MEMDKDLLRNIPLFAGLSEADRTDLAAMMETRTFGEYQPVFWVGERGDELFIVQRGKAAVANNIG